MMKVTSAAAVLAAFLALPACQMQERLDRVIKPKAEDTGTPMSATKTQDQTGAGACGASDLSFMIGMRANEVTFDQAGPVRILAPDSAATTDFVANRLNVMTDAGGNITKFTCG